MALLDLRRFRILHSCLDGTIFSTSCPSSSLDSLPVQLADNLHAYLIESFQAQKLTDLTVTTPTSSLGIHRVVLGAHSPKYFAKFMASPDPNKSDIPPSEIRIEDDWTDNAQSTSLKDALGFLYTSEVGVSEENVDGILKVATTLDVAALISECRQQLLLDFSRQGNVLRLLPVVQKYGSWLEDVARLMVAFVAQEFDKFSSMDDFWNLDGQSLGWIFATDGARKKGAEELLELLFKWLSVDSSKRSAEVSKVLCGIPLENLSVEELTEKVEKHPVLGTDSKCNALLLRAYRCLWPNYTLIREMIKKYGE